MRPYSEDLRTRIVAARQAGQSAQEIAQRFALSKRSVERYCRLQARTGQVRPRRIGGYRRSRLQGHEKTVRRWIRAQNDLTLVELQARCREQLQIQLGLNALWHRLDQWGLTYKKNAARRRASSS